MACGKDTLGGFLAAGRGRNGQRGGGRTTQTEQHGKDKAVRGKVQVKVGQAVQEKRHNAAESSQRQISLGALVADEESAQRANRGSKDHSEKQSGADQPQPRRQLEVVVMSMIDHGTRMHALHLSESGLKAARPHAEPRVSPNQLRGISPEGHPASSLPIGRFLCGKDRKSGNDRFHAYPAGETDAGGEKRRQQRDRDDSVAFPRGHQGQHPQQREEDEQQTFLQLGAPQQLGHAVGCGLWLWGFLHIAKKSGWQVQGFEFSSAAAEVCRQKYGLAVAVGELRELNFPEQSFDVITMRHVLEHMREPLSVLERCCELLVPQGILAIEAPNLNFLVRKSCCYPLSVTLHLYHFSPATLAALVRQAGFEVLECRPAHTGYLFRSKAKIYAKKCIYGLSHLAEKLLGTNVSDSIRLCAKRDENLAGA